MTMITLGLTGSMVSHVHAQALTPLEEDQDGDGDPLNEEQSIIFACSISSSAEDLLGQFVGALNKDDCDFIMHYMSGKCEETSTNGIEMEKICGKSLIDYLDRYDLNNRNFPTDDNQFNEVVDKYLQGRQEAVEKEANKPSWMQ